MHKLTLNLESNINQKQKNKIHKKKKTFCPIQNFKCRVCPTMYSKLKFYTAEATHKNVHKLIKTQHQFPTIRSPTSLLHQLKGLLIPQTKIY